VPEDRRLSLWWRLVRFGFRLLYNELAWTYDMVSWGVSLGQWRAWQRASIPYLGVEGQALVLELAFGTGDLQLDLAEAGLRSIGLDLSPYMGRITSRKLRRKGVPSRLVRGSVLSLPFPAASFEGVVSTFPTEVMVHPSTAQEVSRVLRPGGRFVMVPNGILKLNNPVSRMLEGLYRATGQREPWPGDSFNVWREAGFDLRSETLEMERSVLQIIVAQKSS
jgi:ubiquinone/menaquinone biosynthesis C-methylase UbiE